GAEPALVLGAVQLDHRPIEQGLLRGIAPEQRLAELAVHRRDGAKDALAQVAGAVAVAQLDRFPGTGRSARRHRRATESAAAEPDVNLNGRVAPAVQDFPGADQDDLGLAHAWPPGR